MIPGAVRGRAAPGVRCARQDLGVSQGSSRYASQDARVLSTLRLVPSRSSTAVRVAEVTAMFWVIKGLSKALGESTSDYLVFAVNPVIAVLGAFVVFVIALGLQPSRGRYHPWTYWFAVVMVGIFGTMAADVVHVVLAVLQSRAPSASRET